MIFMWRLFEHWLIFQIMLIVAITLAFFVLNALLWYVRPSGEVWLLASIVLGVIWGAIFLRLITSDTGGKAT
jgi:hypothetical protein